MALHVEVADLVSSARVDSVNGCNRADFLTLVANLRQGLPSSAVTVRSGCHIDDSLIPNGYVAVRTSSLPLQHLVTAQLGVSVRAF